MMIEILINNTFKHNQVLSKFMISNVNYNIKLF